MAFNGSGTFARLFTWATDRTNSVPVTASRMDSEMDGMATGLSTCIAKDGQTTTTTRIPFASGVSAAAGSASAASYCATNDANTGVYFPGSDEVALTAGGTQVIDATATVVTIPTGVTLKANTTPYDAFPTGTQMVFIQTSAPTGWTKQTDHNDKALRIVTGTVGAGGSSAFSTVFGKTATDPVTLAAGNIPSHTHTGTTNSGGSHGHTVSGGTIAGTSGIGNTNGVGTSVPLNPTAITVDSGGSHTHGFTTDATGSGTSFSPAIDLRVAYLDCIIAAKN